MPDVAIPHKGYTHFCKKHDPEIKAVSPHPAYLNELVRFGKGAPDSIKAQVGFLSKEWHNQCKISFYT